MLYSTQMARKFQTISLFPQMFEAVFNQSMLWKAQDRSIVSFKHWNLREFGIGPRKQVDDTPYGGGDGMLLKPEPLFAAIRAAKAEDPTARVVLLTPRGRRWKQALARELSKEPFGLIFVCARYEGYDERITALVDYQISIGDYVLTGGEIPAMVVADSIIRLIPGVLGGETSAEIESFTDPAALEAPQYTRPATFEDLAVPEVLLSGNHAEIEAWRRKHAQAVIQEDPR